MRLHAGYICTTLDIQVSGQFTINSSLRSIHIFHLQAQWGESCEHEDPWQWRHGQRPESWRGPPPRTLPGWRHSGWGSEARGYRRWHLLAFGLLGFTFFGVNAFQNMAIPQVKPKFACVLRDAVTLCQFLDIQHCLLRYLHAKRRNVRVCVVVGGGGGRGREGGGGGWGDEWKLYKKDCTINHIRIFVNNFRNNQLVDYISPRQFKKSNNTMIGNNYILHDLFSIRLDSGFWVQVSQTHTSSVESPSDSVSLGASCTSTRPSATTPLRVRRGGNMTPGNISPLLHRYSVWTAVVVILYYLWNIHVR